MKERHLLFVLAFGLGVGVFVAAVTMDLGWLVAAIAGLFAGGVVAAAALRTRQ